MSVDSNCLLVIEEKVKKKTTVTVLAKEKKTIFKRDEI